MSSKNKKRNKRAAHTKQVAQSASQKAKAALVVTTKTPGTPAASGVAMNLGKKASKPSMSSQGSGKRVEPEKVEKGWFGKLLGKLKPGKKSA
jgi:hypothetical protein